MDSPEAKKAEAGDDPAVHSSPYEGLSHNQMLDQFFRAKGFTRDKLIELFERNMRPEEFKSLKGQVAKMAATLRNGDPVRLGALKALMSEVALVDGDKERIIAAWVEAVASHIGVSVEALKTTPLAQLERETKRELRGLLKEVHNVVKNKDSDVRVVNLPPDELDQLARDGDTKYYSGSPERLAILAYRRQKDIPIWNAEDKGYRGNGWLPKTEIPEERPEEGGETEG